MQELKAEKPPESPEGSDPVMRLMERLAEEGFTTEQSPAEWEEFGEIIFRRSEKISVASGETVFIFTKISDLNERILRQTSESVVNSTTVYHCLVTTTDQPQNVLLGDFITRSGGATFIPVVFVPGINQVLYPLLEDKLGTVKPRVEYLQYLLGERRETVNMHRTTLQAFYVSMGVVAVLLLAVVASLVL
jgi:hypothetical protein